jgi:hypothetical protein
LQRTFFISDVNFWFREDGVSIVAKGNPITGLQIPLSINYSQVKFDSKSRWRLGASGGFSFNLMDKSSGGKSGMLRSLDQRREINYTSFFSPAKRSFFTFDIGVFVKYRLSEKLWVNYVYSHSQNLLEPIVVNNIFYSLTNPISATDYVAQTVVNGK